MLIFVTMSVVVFTLSSIKLIDVVTSTSSPSTSRNTRGASTSTSTFFISSYTSKPCLTERLGLTFLHIQSGPKSELPTVSQQIVLQCVPIKLVLSDLSVTHVVPHKHIIFRLPLNILSVKCSMHGVILDA